MKFDSEEDATVFYNDYTKFKEFDTFEGPTYKCNCLKITEDKSSDSKVYTLDARLIKAIHCNTKTQSLKHASQRHCNVKTRGSKPASQHHCNVKTLSSKPTHASQHNCNAKTQFSKPASSKARSTRLVRLEARVSVELKARV